MGKDRREQRRTCLRCDNWAEEGSELCSDCEDDTLNQLNSTKEAEDMYAKYDDILDQGRADSLEGGE